MTKLIFVAMLSLLILSSSAYAFCFEEAGKMYKISPNILKAIAQVESNMQPDAVNYNKNSTYDYGLMQINTFWYSKIGHQLWMEIGDPCVNVKVGAWILAGCFKRHGYDSWIAVGCYHSPTPKRQKKYIVKIKNALKNM